MSDYAQRMKVYEKVDRAVKLATTYVRKAEDALHWPEAPKPLLVGYWSLLDQMLDAAVEIAERLPDDYFEESEGGNFFGLAVGRHNMSDDLLERAQKVLAAVEARRAGAKDARRIAALENTEGRTPEEAELYRAKAKQLRRAAG